MDGPYPKLNPKALDKLSQDPLTRQGNQRQCQKPYKKVETLELVALSQLKKPIVVLAQPLLKR